MESEFIVAITAILIGGMVIILPLAGLVARFALKPLIDSYAQVRESAESGDSLRMLERRLDLLEEQVQLLERDNSRLLDAAEFQRRLESAP
jgi:hypothetical protein